MQQLLYKLFRLPSFMRHSKIAKTHSRQYSQGVAWLFVVYCALWLINFAFAYDQLGLLEALSSFFIGPAIWLMPPY